MNLEIRVTIEAEETYQIIIEQLRERWGDKFVIKLEDKVSTTIELISKTPFVYPVARENSETRKCVLHKNCSMFYKISDDFVEIIFFWDNCQEPLVALL